MNSEKTKSQLKQYTGAFGEVQAEWLDGIIRPAMTPLDNLMLQAWLPVRVQRWWARRSGFAVVRSLIPGGHQLVVTKKDKVLGRSTYEITDNGWVMKEEGLDEKSN